MNVAVDLRSLQSGEISGVENYILNVLENLLPIDKRNTYTLFYNAWKPGALKNLHFVNSRLVSTRIPNKFLNLSLRTFQWPRFSRLIGKFDCLFMPNFNHFAISPNQKLVVTVHDLSPLFTPYHYDTRRRVWHRLLNFRRILDRADRIIAVSEFTKSDLESRLGIDSKKIRVIYPGIDHLLFNRDLSVDKLRQVRNHYGLPGSYILFLSTIEPRKNLTTLLKAFEQLKFPIHLVIAGRQGWKYKEVFRKMDQSPKKRFIHYIGYIPEEDKPYLLKLANVIVYPSFYEGFGFVPLEAMSVGVPVVTSQVTSLPEVVGSSALTVNPNNVHDLHYALEEILRNETARQKLISGGLQQSEKFNWQQTALQTLEVFNSL